MTCWSILTIALLTAQPLAPGQSTRTLEVDGQKRSYIVHVPTGYDRTRPAPVVLAFHGAAMNGSMMAWASGLSQKADAAGFLVVYPNGTGRNGVFLIWNAGGFRGPGADRWPDDVKFVQELLKDLATVANIDQCRIYATGISNGGMMCYRLAAELSGRIAAIAPVAGTIATDQPRPERPVSVIHFHGTADTLVPFQGPTESSAKFLHFQSVPETIRTWAAIDGCPPKPRITELPDTVDDGTRVRREYYGPGTGGAEVVLYVIDGGGHTWPGHPWPTALLGKATQDISANDLIWEFFQRHPR